jgi:protein SCO1/2
MHRRGVIVALLVALAGCRQAPPAREYRVVGQILSIDRRGARLTLRHEDIEGFMPAMTMPYRVKDPGLLDGRKAGELVDATLAVQGADAWITRLSVTGVAPVPPSAPVQTSLAPGDPVPDATFVDQDGRPVRVRDLRGQPLVLSFVYTRCPFPDFCPAIESRLLALQQRVKSDPRLAGTGILAVSLDPAYDRPAVLRAHAAERGADPAIWRFVTGSVADVDGFGRQFGVSVTRGSGSPADIEHNLRTIVVSREGRIERVEHGADWHAEDLVDSLLRAAGRL